MLHVLLLKQYSLLHLVFQLYQVLIDERQFIFCTEVFLELGIFSVTGGRLRFESKVKNALDNSKIYRAIAELKGN